MPLSYCQIVLLFTFKKFITMANYETGHAKNVANFEDLLAIITSFGASYNPVKVALKIINLTPILTQAKADLQTVTTKTVLYNNAANARATLFEPIKPLATRIVNAFKATDASAEAIKEIKSVNRKLQGRRATPIPTTTPPPATISASQQSYDQIIEHFNRLIEIVKTETTYTPNENDLKVATLTPQIAALRATNAAVATAYASVYSARIARDKTLYKQKTGIYYLTLDIKSYVRSLYGNASAENKQIGMVKFKIIS